MRKVSVQKVASVKKIKRRMGLDRSLVDFRATYTPVENALAEIIISVCQLKEDDPTKVQILSDNVLKQTNHMKMLFYKISRLIKV